MTVPVIPDVPTAGGVTIAGTIAGHTATTHFIEPNTDGSINVVQEEAAAVTATLQTAQAGADPGTALSLLGNSAVVFTLAATGYTGTVNWEGSEDGTNYDPISTTQLGTSTIVTSVALSGATSTHLYEASVAGLQKVRARTSSASGGSVTITAHAVPVAYNTRTVNANLVAGTAVIGSTTIQATSGTALGADVTNSELRVSNYVKTSAAGDTALTLGQATMANSLPVAIASNQGAIGNLSSPYPQGATPITAASGDVAASTAAATLSATSAKTTYITGFTFTSTGSTGAASVDITITNTITGTLTFVYCSIAGATLTNPVLSVVFPYPIPASTTNQTIIASCPTLGSGNLHAAMVAYGFIL
jgi:hypothetical protein